MKILRYNMKIKYEKFLKNTLGIRLKIMYRRYTYEV